MQKHIQEPKGINNQDIQMNITNAFTFLIQQQEVNGEKGLISIALIIMLTTFDLNMNTLVKFKDTSSPK